MLNDVQKQAVSDGVLALQALYRARNSGEYNKRIENAITNTYDAIEELIKDMGNLDQKEMRYQFPFLKTISGNEDEICLEK